MRKSAQLLKKTLQFTDDRAKIEGELLAAMDVVKCSTWEVCCPHLPVGGNAMAAFAISETLHAAIV